MPSTINVLIDTFPGLGLPSTLCLPLPSSALTTELFGCLADLLPPTVLCSSRLVLTTTDSRCLNASTDAPLGEYLHDEEDFLSLRLLVPIHGGKGGFGSQLRAAGGRMSSKKRRQNAELATGSARNLDGHRLRTITEAKNLAAYLATKPDMDRKEKEERRKRWEQVVELAEQREADMRSGKGADGRRKGLSDEWIETKEEVGENVRNAVKIAMKAAEKDQATTSDGSDESVAHSDDDSDAESDVMELDEQGMSKLKSEAERGDVDAIWVLKHKLKIPSQHLPAQASKYTRRRFAGFDDDDDEEDTSSSEGGGDNVSTDKGKAKAV